VHGIIYIGGAYIVNKRGSFILTFSRQIFSSQQHPLFITRSPFRSVSVLSSISLSPSLFFFISSLFFLSHFFSLRLLLLSQTIVCTRVCVRVCVCFVFRCIGTFLLIHMYCAVVVVVVAGSHTPQHGIQARIRINDDSSLV